MFILLNFPDLQSYGKPGHPGGKLMQNGVPPSFLFHYSIPVPRNERLPRAGESILKLPPSARIFIPSTLNTPNSPAEIRMAWNPRGLGISVRISGKVKPVIGRINDLKHSDQVQIMIDTRRTGDVHRATAWCSSFLIVPVDESTGGSPQIVKLEPGTASAVRQKAIAEDCILSTDRFKDGYQLEVWIPETRLPGFAEVQEIGELGFYCVIYDTELGEIPLSVGGDFPVTLDPSTWLRMELTG